MTILLKYLNPKNWVDLKASSKVRQRHPISNQEAHKGGMTQSASLGGVYIWSCSGSSWPRKRNMVQQCKVSRTYICRSGFSRCLMTHNLTSRKNSLATSGEASLQKLPTAEGWLFVWHFLFNRGYRLQRQWGDDPRYHGLILPWSVKYYELRWKIWQSGL
jgi:hypothetical protein